MGNDGNASGPSGASGAKGPSGPIFESPTALVASFRKAIQVPLKFIMGEASGKEDMRGKVTLEIRKNEGTITVAVIENTLSFLTEKAKEAFNKKLLLYAQSSAESTYGKSKHSSISARIPLVISPNPYP